MYVEIYMCLSTYMEIYIYLSIDLYIYMYVHISHIAGASKSLELEGSTLDPGLRTPGLQPELDVSRLQRKVMISGGLGFRVSGQNFEHGYAKTTVGHVRVCSMNHKACATAPCRKRLSHECASHMSRLQQNPKRIIPSPSAIPKPFAELGSPTRSTSLGIQAEGSSGPDAYVQDLI